MYWEDLLEFVRMYNMELRFVVLGLIMLGFAIWLYIAGDEIENKRKIDLLWNDPSWDVYHQGDAWTNEDIEILREMAGYNHVSKIALELKRSVKATQRKAEKLGISLRVRK